jgi:hypothetical protein
MKGDKKEKKNQVTEEPVVVKSKKDKKEKNKEKT